ncbi:uncharacterized protein LOC128503401 [Spea bombifrons]|uniref:uncharacterized protein LOC128503401 n=1 Tax=Spea bombifrons TaxID=233779 RepID=UPI00234A14FD|nr:uncharacterized protein LOC128503401 [Spea bombifrons]
MLGPHVLLVAVTVCASVLGTLGKPLLGVSHDDLGIRRVRRSLPASGPYEADVLSYLPAENLRNEPLYPDISQAMLARLAAYPQEELLAQALERMASRRVEPNQENLSFQQLLEDGQRREKENVYLANLLHLWNQIGQGRGYPEQLQGLRGPLKPEGDVQRTYQNYDENGAGSVRPPLSRNQMAQALSHYRQDGPYDVGAFRMQPEEPSDEGVPVDEEMLRYLVTRVLSAMSEAEMPQRIAPPPGRRMRRSTDQEINGDFTSNLLRVKRLDDDPDADYESAGLLRRKRIDGDLETRPKHFPDQRVTEQLLRYLPN